MKLLSHTHIYCTFLLGMVLLIGCAQTYKSNIQRGSDYKFQKNHPQVQFTASGKIGLDNPKIDIAANIIYKSLIITNNNNQRKANISIDILISGKDKNSSVKKHFDIEINISNIKNGNGYYLFRKKISVTPGSYAIHFTVTDQNSNKSTTRTTNLIIPDPTKKELNLSNIRIFGKDTSIDTSWVPIITYSIPSRIDSLLFRFQVVKQNRPLSLKTKLLEIQYDSSVARPVFFSNYSASTIEYTGINYNDKTTLQETNRKIIESGNILIEYRFGELDRGNYRFEIRSKRDKIFKAHDFSIKSKNYPFLQSPCELARPLIYLMDDGNYEKLLSIKNSDSLKNEIDKFWLKEIGNKKEASQVLKKYYNRVEEANKQFSNFKEGWKTDPGMVYILFGAPVFVQNTFGKMEWNYSNNVVTSDRTFIFSKPKINNDFFPFEHYILQRSKAYYNLVYQQKKLWLSDLILIRNF